MSIMIQVRNVPDAIHRELKSRAAKEGMSLSDYVLRHIEELASLPTLEQMRERLARLPPVDLDHAAAVRAERDAR